MKIANKTIIVTGAGSGIGRALTLLLLKKGARVAAIGRTEDKLLETKKLAGKNGNNMSAHALDIADKKSVENLPKKIAAEHEAIDGLINNAGIIQPFVKINNLSYEDIERVMQTNFYGMLYMTKTFLPILLKRPEAHIVNVSSMGGFLPVPGQSVYGASKAAVKLFTEGLASELSDTHVRVSVVFPGAIATNITKNSGVAAPVVSSQDLKKFQALPADTAAHVIVTGMESNKTRIYVGKDSKMMNALYRLSPSYATNLITKQMRSLLNN